MTGVDHAEIINIRNDIKGEIESGHIQQVEVDHIRVTVKIEDVGERNS